MVVTISQKVITSSVEVVTVLYMARHHLAHGHQPFSFAGDLVGHGANLQAHGAIPIHLGPPYAKKRQNLLAEGLRLVLLGDFNCQGCIP